MRIATTTMSLPEVGFTAATRAALGAGIGMLVADRLEPRMRSRVGGGLLALGLATTIPVIIWIVSGVGAAPPSGE